MADCSLPTLVKQSACFDCLSLSEKLGLRNFFLSQAVKAFGGTDFTNINTRRKAIACINCLPDFRLDSMYTLITQRLAINAGAGAAVNLPIAALRKQISCLPCGSTYDPYDPESVFLLCLLNAFIGSGAQ